MIGPRNLSPWSPAMRRIAIVAVVLIAVVLIGLFDVRRSSTPTDVTLLLTGPGNRREFLPAVLSECDRATERIWVSMFVSHHSDVVEQIVQHLRQAVRRGVKVQVALDYNRQEPDKNQDMSKRLRAAGVRVVFDEPALTSHAKIMVFDGKVAVLGSHNWTRNAMTSNREASLLIRDPELCKQLEDFISSIPGWDRRH